MAIFDHTDEPKPLGPPREAVAAHHGTEYTYQALDAAEASGERMSRMDRTDNA